MGEWREFVGPAVEIIHASIAQEVEEEIEEIQAEKRRQAEASILESVSQTELEDFLRSHFDAADQDKSGKVDVRELRAALSKLGCNLSDAEINYLLFSLDTDENGALDVEEFMPVAYSMLIESVMAVRDW